MAVIGIVRAIVPGGWLFSNPAPLSPPPERLMAAAADLETLDFAAEERAKLQRHFGRFDILFFLICTIVGVDPIAPVAQGGGEAFTWMMGFALLFFIPQALLFAELGAAF